MCTYEAFKLGTREKKVVGKTKFVSHTTPLFSNFFAKFSDVIQPVSVHRSHLEESYTVVIAEWHRIAIAVSLVGCDLAIAAILNQEVINRAVRELLLCLRVTDSEPLRPVFVIPVLRTCLEHKREASIAF